MLDFVNKWKNKVAHYVDVRVQLMKLSIVERISSVLSYFIFVIVSVFLIVTVLLFIGIGTAEFFADVLNSKAGGFFLTAGIYLLLVIMLFTFRTSIVGKFAGIFISMLTQDDDDDDDKDERDQNQSS